MEEFTLINKKRDRIKIFKPFEDVVNLVQLLMQWRLNMLVYIKDQVNQLSKVQEQNPLKMQERNISSYWRTDGRRPVYLKAIFKTNFNTT